MAFTELIVKAVNGDQGAYDELCSGLTDCLYTIALMTLRSEDDARFAVMSAVSEGYSSISEIKDEPHLKAWLVRELTKYNVTRLKDCRLLRIGAELGEGITDTAELTDIERLIFSITAAGGYNVRETALITGLSDQTIKEKLRSSEEKLGAKADEIRRLCTFCKAPASLKALYDHNGSETGETQETGYYPEFEGENEEENEEETESFFAKAGYGTEDEKPPHRPSLSDTLKLRTASFKINEDYGVDRDIEPKARIDFSDNLKSRTASFMATGDFGVERDLGSHAEGSVPEKAKGKTGTIPVKPAYEPDSENETESFFAKAGYGGIGEQEEKPFDYLNIPEGDEEDGREEAPEGYTVGAHDYTGDDGTGEEDIDYGSEEADYPGGDEYDAYGRDDGALADNGEDGYYPEDRADYDGDEEDDDAGEDYDEEYAEPEPEPAKRAQSVPGLNAATFVALASAEKVKGTEFLSIIGNTRISNSVYREIEKNPNLTKQRIIDLLESSKLTDADYYKMISALKQRRDMIKAREEDIAMHEKAGLYDGSRRKRERRQKAEEKSELRQVVESMEAKNGLSAYSRKVDESDPESFLSSPTSPSRNSSWSFLSERAVKSAPMIEPEPEPEEYAPKKKNKREPEPEEYAPKKKTKREPEPEEYVPKKKNKREPEPEEYAPKKKTKREPEPEEYVPEKKKEAFVLPSLFGGDKEITSEKPENSAARQMPPATSPIKSAVPSQPAEKEPEEKAPPAAGIDPFSVISAKEDVKPAMPRRLIPEDTENEEAIEARKRNILTATLPIGSHEDFDREIRAEKEKYGGKLALDSYTVEIPSAVTEKSAYEHDVIYEESDIDREREKAREEARKKQQEELNRMTFDVGEKRERRSDDGEYIGKHDGVLSAGDISEGRVKKPENDEPDEIKVMNFGGIFADDDGSGEDELPEDEERSDRKIMSFGGVFAQTRPNEQESAPAPEPVGRKISFDSSYIDDDAPAPAPAPSNKMFLSFEEFMEEQKTSEDEGYDEEAEPGEPGEEYGEEAEAGETADEEYEEDEDYEEEEDEPLNLGKTNEIPFELPSGPKAEKPAGQSAGFDINTLNFSKIEYEASAHVMTREETRKPRSDDGEKEEELGFVPDFSAFDDDDEDEDDDDFGSPARSGKGSSKPRAKREKSPVKIPARAPEGTEKGGSLGTNRSKLLACAACAVLLVGTGLVLKLTVPGFGTEASATSPAQTEKKKETKTPEEDPAALREAESDAVQSGGGLPPKVGSHEDIYDALAAARFDGSVVGFDTDYLGASGRGYTDILTKTACASSGVAYIRTDNRINSYSLDSSEKLGSLKIDTSRELLGFTADDSGLYVFLYGESNGRPSVNVMVFNENIELVTNYSQDGSFISARLENGRLLLATTLTVNAFTADRNEAKTFIPNYTLNKKRYMAKVDHIFPMSGAQYASYTVVGALMNSKAKLTVCMGGYTGYVIFGKDGFATVTPDSNKTYISSFSLNETASAYNGSSEFVGEAFCADCFGDGAFVGFDPENGVIEVSKNGSVFSCSVGSEVPSGAVFSDDGICYVMTKQQGGASKLYGFDVSGESPVNTTISPENVYTEKLSEAGSLLMGLTSEPAEDGTIAGLRFSLYAYDAGWHKLTELADSIIGLPSGVSDENLRYLSSIAQENVSALASDENGTLFAVPTSYFDGVSERERIVTLSYDGALKETGEMILYDTKCRGLLIRSDILYILTDSGVIKANAADCSKIG